MRANAIQIASSLSTNINTLLTKRSALLFALISLDTVMILAGFWWAYAVRFQSGITVWAYLHVIPPHDYYQQFVFFLVPMWIIVFAIFGLYDFKNLFSGTREYALVFNAGTLGIMLVILFSFFETSLVIARAWVVLSWVFVILGVCFGRFVFRRIIHHMRTSGRFMTRVLVIGINEEGQAIAQQLHSNPKAGIQIVGFADDTITGAEPLTDMPVLGTINSISEIAQKYEIQAVIITSTALSRPHLLKLVQDLHSANIPTRLSSGFYELLTTGVEVHDVGNVPLISINKVRLTGADVIMKRALDIVGAATALLLLSPIMLVMAIAIKFNSSGPVIYRRRVVGVGGKLFDAFKFRTMAVDADARLAQDAALRQQFEQNYKLKDDPRVTRVGRILRRTSLDELPQLFNVLFGQMSLVGPRMITASELAYYGKWSMNLSTVKPGITGLWQVSGRSDVTYNERVMLDMNYIRNYSIWFDIYLLWLTIPAVLKSRGAY